MYHASHVRRAILSRASSSPTARSASSAFWSNGMSDGQAHNAYPLAFATVGSAGGRIRGNRYLIAPEWSPIANLWLGVAGLYDSPIESIGESNARFELV